MTRFIFLLCTGVLCYSCVHSNKKNVAVLNDSTVSACAANSAAAVTATAYITDSISPYNKKIRKYGNDSIYAYTLDDTLSSIEYLDTASAVIRIIFEGGKKTFVEYNPNYSKDSLLNEYFFENSGKISSRTYLRDTVIITDGNPIGCYHFYMSYHENGKIKEIGYRGGVWGQNGPIGLHKTYNKAGRLVSSKNFIYPKQAVGSPGSPSFTYIIEVDYYDNGNPKWEKMYDNYVFHESGEDDKEPVGTWKFYDETGELTGTEYHSSIEKRLKRK